MQQFELCKNIIVNGNEYTEGFLGLDWFSSKDSDKKKEDYEYTVVWNLNKMHQMRMGRILFQEICAYFSKTMKILPYHPSDGDPVNATSTPDDDARSALRGTTILDDQGNLPKASDRVLGTGQGCSLTINYTPSTFSPSNSRLSGAGITPDEVLFHEMVHGVRQMAGRSVTERIVGNPKLDNYEEFVAILVANIYISEKGWTMFRADHWGFSLLNENDSKPANFLSKYKRYISYMFMEQPRFCENIAKVNCAFNPLSLY